MARKPSKPALPPSADDRIVVLHGPELFLRTELTDAVRRELTDRHGEIEVFRFTGTETTVAEVLDECRSFGLMQQPKLVVVDDAEALINEDSRPAWTRYAESPTDSVCLVLRASRWYPGNLDKAINQVGCVYKCESPTLDQAVSVAGRWARDRHGSSIEREAAQLLVEKVGADLGRLDSELAKLALSAGEGPINRGHVSDLVGATREEVVWSIQEATLSGSPEAALSHLARILDRSGKDATVPAMWACVDLSRKLALASAAMERGEGGQGLMRELKLWGPAGDRLLRAARSVAPHEARALFKAALEADRASKSGLGTPRGQLERLALRLSATLAR